MLVKQCFSELYLNSMYKRFLTRQRRLQLKKCFSVIKAESEEGIEYRESFERMHRRRRLRTAIDSLQEYTLRKLAEQKKSSAIRA